MFKKAAISGIFNSFEWSKEYDNDCEACFLYDLPNLKWVGVNGGYVQLY